MSLPNELSEEHYASLYLVLAVAEVMEVVTADERLYNALQGTAVEEGLKMAGIGCGS